MALGKEVADPAKSNSTKTTSDAQLIALEKAYADVQADAKATAQNRQVMPS